MDSSSGQNPEPVAFYAPLQDSLSQGDLVHGVPWGLIPDPLEICKKQGGPHQAKTHVVEDLPAAFRKGPESILAQADRGLAIVLWPDCQLDKFKNQGRPEDKWFAGIAPVVPMEARLSEEVREQVRGGIRRMYSFVPANPPLGIPESYIDFRHIWSVKQTLLRDRVGALSDSAREALMERLFAFFTYRHLKSSLSCPSCGAGFSPATFFEADSAPDI
jgi:hypothetical protein